ncbi:putative phage tail fiber protein [Vibrio phage vB_VpaP_VP-3220]|nr:putative phage tail fiber protein [Vibrio phage vB_VpaP_VP-3220]
MSSSWYRRGTVTVTDGSKEVVGVGTLWVDAGNKPLAGDIMFIAGSIYEVESITDNEHLSLFRPFTGVPPANGEYAIIRNTSVTIATRVAAMVAAAINSKQVLLDDLRGYYTSTADKVLIHTDDGSTIEVVPLQTLVSDITNLIAQSESIKNDLANTQAALDLVRQYSNAAQGVEVEPGKYSAKSYAADAADTLALVNKAKSDVDLKASQVQQTKTDIEQFVSTSKTEIDAKATAISKAIDTQATTVKGEITDLTSTSKQEITALATKSKKDITTLTTTSKSEINTLVSTSKTEITELATTEKAAISQQSTTAISEMTSLKQSAEQAASTATQKATQAAASATSAAQSKTDAQTLKTQTEALANETKQVAEEIKSGSYVGWQIYCQSEANMKAARMLASEQFAASGFVHYGRGYTGSSPANGTLINEGLWSRTVEASLANALLMGRTSPTSNNGTSKTLFPVTHIAGFISNLFFNENGGNYTSAIKFPYAPNGTVVYDSTGNCRGSGKATLDLTKDVDSKYGDVAGSVNEAVARAFEGMTQNGDFRNGTRYWNTSAVSTAASGGVTVKGSNTNMGKDTNQYYNCIVGKQYTVEIVCSAYRAGALTLTNDSLKHRALDVNGVGTFKTIFTASSDPKYFLWLLGADMDITSVSVKPVSEEVVINRVDMFGFEYFLEEISKANPFVYPYGCIQSKLTSIEGIATKESNRPITYYSVFDGDTTSKGKGVDFWAATDAQKRALVSNPDHNIYLLDDGRLVQWRVRQRTIAGVGNGDWQSVNSQGVALMFFQAPSGFTIQPSAQGILDVTPTWFGAGSKGAYYGITHATPIHKDNGIFCAGLGGKVVPELGIDGHCYFHVCGVVPRLNQGAYHPSFNPMGCGLEKNTGRYWYGDIAPYTSTLDCMLRVHPQSGHIGFGSGRPDGKLYDAIYASGQGGVIDYRTPAKDMSSKEEASKIFQKVVNGSYRGEELLTQSKVIAALTAQAFYVNTAGKQFQLIDATPLLTNLQEGDVVYAQNAEYTLRGVAITLGSRPTFDYTIVSGTPVGEYQSGYLIHESKTNIPVSGNFTQVDVIGSPEKILATPVLANGWVGSWNPEIPKGTSQAYQLVRKMVTSGNTFTAPYTTNNGTSWSSQPLTINGTTNAVTANWDDRHIWVVPYTAFAKQTKPSTNKPVLNGSEGIGFVWASADNYMSQGQGLIETLIGKVGKDNQDGNQETRLALTKHFMQPEGTLKKGDVRKHTPIDLKKPINDSPAVKTLWYQTAENQQCSLNFAWNELVWKNLIVKDVNTASSPVKQGEVYVIKADVPLKGQIFKANGNNAGWNWSGMYMGDEGEVYYGGGNSVSLDTTVKSYQGKSDGWGDDSTIRIIDGIGTFINLNGDTCLYGTHELAIPYGYTKNKARAGSQVSGVDL